MLQRDLSKLKMLWNTHRIRKSHENVIGGIPNQLFYIPEYFGFQNCGLEVTEEDISNIDGIENLLNEAMVEQITLTKSLWATFTIFCKTSNRFGLVKVGQMLLKVLTL